MKTNTSIPRRTLRFLIFLLSSVGCALILVASVAGTRRHGPIAELPVADGRTIQVEAVSYGTNHFVGQPSVMLNRFRPWLPDHVYNTLAPQVPQNHLSTDSPSLVVWLTAIDPGSGTNVDCQSLRVEFESADGTIFREETRHWFGGQAFWRIAHVFQVFPRSEDRKLRITPWQPREMTNVTIANPHVVEPVVWTADDRSPTQHVDDIDITLTTLNVRTNGGADAYWESPVTYLEPQFELIKNGRPVEGFLPPEWTAEDTLGNVGIFLGTNHAMLKFDVKWFPKTTNEHLATRVCKLPTIDLSNLTTNLVLNSEIHQHGVELDVVGIMTPGVNAFLEGEYHAKPSISTRTIGGASGSGWIGTGKQVTPFHYEQWHEHYTRVPTVYLRVKALEPGARIGVRLRNETGRLWAADSEPQGARDGVQPFLISEGEGKVIPEVVLLEPLSAEFTVKTTESDTISSNLKTPKIRQ